MSLGELIYFPVQAKGLQLAILAEASGLEWTGFTVDKSPAGPKSWPAIKASGASPFGQLPMLRTPGGRVVGQSVAIANYIAHRASMHGAGDDDFALSQMCLAEGEDLYSLLLGAELARWKPREVRAAKAEAVRGLIATTVPDHLAKLEALCAAPLGFTSTGQTAGELYLFGMLYQTAAVAGAASLDATPRLKAWFDRTKALPAVAKVLEGRSAIGSLGQYFMNDADYDRFNAA